MIDPRLIDPVEFAVANLGFRPDATQERILSANVSRGIINCSRQWGKSTVMAVKAIHDMAIQSGIVDEADKNARALIERVLLLAGYQ